MSPEFLAAAAAVLIVAAILLLFLAARSLRPAIPPKSPGGPEPTHQMLRDLYDDLR